MSVTLCVLECGLADTPWPMFGHDARHTGRSSFTGPEAPGEKWSLAIGGPLESSPTIAADGTIYVGSRDQLHAVNPNGTEIWSFAIETFTSYSPAIGADGTIYAGSKDSLHAIDPDGSLRWSSLLTRNSVGATSPTIGADGSIYVYLVGTDNGDTLYAVGPNGTVKWSLANPRAVNPSPAVGADGTIYLGSHDLYAINPDGTIKWSFAPERCICYSPAIGSDGTIYGGSRDDRLYAINPNGSLKWRLHHGSQHRVFPHHRWRWDHLRGLERPALRRQSRRE